MLSVVCCLLSFVFDAAVSVVVAAADAVVIVVVVLLLVILSLCICSHEKIMIFCVGKKGMYARSLFKKFHHVTVVVYTNGINYIN